MTPDEKPLYDDGLIRILYNPRSHEDHDVFVGDFVKGDYEYLYLPRGILDQFARTHQVDNIRQSLSAMQQYGFEEMIGKRGVSLERLALAFAKAVIKDQENLQGELLSEIRNLRDNAQ